MGGPASIVLASSATGFVARLLITFCYVYILLILLYVISQMLPLPYSPWLARIQRFLYDVCEPYIRLFRRFMPPLGPLDLSPFVASLVLVIAAQLVARTL